MKATGCRTSGRRFICCNPPAEPNRPECIFSKKNIDILVELSYIPVAGKKLPLASHALKKESLTRWTDIRIVAFPAESNQHQTPFNPRYVRQSYARG